jgi:hypothetical protein
MLRGCGLHLDEDLMDRYALQTAADQELATVEEHLLICGVCRRRLVELERFISALKQCHRDLASGHSNPK